MNKTAVFTSLTMLLSIAQYGVSAEAAQLEEKVNQSRKIYELTPTRGRTRYQLERLILPSYPGYGEKSVGIGAHALTACVIAGSIGLGVNIPATHTITMPASALATGGWMNRMGKIERHNEYKKRPSRTPLLRTSTPQWKEKTLPILTITNAGDEEGNKTFFNMETLEELHKRRMRLYADEPPMSRPSLTALAEVKVGVNMARRAARQLVGIEQPALEE